MSLWPKEALDAFRNAKSLLVLTGSGVSAESGIATFRGPGGLWKDVNPLEIATPEAYARDPKRVWEWYEARRAQIREAEPNRAHRALARLETRVPSFTLATQNVDRLHQKAGSRRVLELHGSLWVVRCTAGCGEWEDWHELADLPYRCPRCDAGARPGVVWFGEALPAEVWREAAEAADSCDLVLVAGTSALVHPAAALPLRARERGRPVAEVNPEVTELTPLATWSVRAGAGDALEELAEVLAPEKGEAP